MVFGVHKRSKRLPMAPITLLNASPILHKRDIFETAVIGVNIILVASFADVEHTCVLSVDIYDGRSPCLIVNIQVLGGVALYDGIPKV